MEDRQRIISIYVEKEAYTKGSVDITEKVYELFPKEEIEVIKYTMPSVTEQGIYFTVVFVEKEENAKKGMGF